MNVKKRSVLYGVVSHHHPEFSSSNVDGESLLYSSLLSFTVVNSGVGGAVEPCTRWPKRPLQAADLFYF